MSDERDSRGRFGQNNRANILGRPRRARSVGATILNELNALVDITENQKRRKISKLAANAKQIANQGASGGLRAAQIALNLALKAEAEQATTPTAAKLSGTDREIVERFLARLRLTEMEASDAADA